MTIEEAVAIMREVAAAADDTSRFTPKEREAITMVTHAWMTRAHENVVTEALMCELFACKPDQLPARMEVS